MKSIQNAVAALHECVDAGAKRQDSINRENIELKKQVLALKDRIKELEMMIVEKNFCKVFAIFLFHDLII